MEANNVKALRKTLEEMATDLEDLANSEGIRAPAYSSIFSLYAEKCRKALAAPPRNCDVGTAEEQVERFHRQCFEYHTGRCSPHCRTLPAKTRQECALKWAQMPYEEGGAK